jgi:predicted ATPase
MVSEWLRAGVDSDMPFFDRSVPRAASVSQFVSMWPGFGRIAASGDAEC